MKKLLFVVIIFLLTFHCFADNFYSAALIPDAMKENANAVVRLNETIFEISSIGSAVEKHHEVITVLNKNGERFAEFYAQYDKFVSISGVTAKIYDATGKVAKKISNSDIKDYSNFADFSLFQDDRALYYQPIVNNYPYTVEYEWKETHKGLLFYPIWMPQHNENISVMFSNFKIVIPNDMTFRYKELNLPTTAVFKDDAKNKTYEWSIESLKAFESEPYSPPANEILPVVYTAPNDFQIENTNGNMQTWEKFGLWNNKLLDERQILPEKTKLEISALVSGITDKRAIVEKIYEFMQNKTRYVSVQVGIGGWQPFEASLVDKVGYGDCKALSNYTKALLSVAGIQSIYTVVSAGDNAFRLFKDFPINYFNHVIVCVPLDKDTMWLECTDQQHPCGYVGNFTDDRDVLLIENTGGKIVHTPVYEQKQNTENRSAKVTIDETGNAQATVSESYSGLNYDYMREVLSEKSDQQKKLVIKTIDLQNFDLISYTVSQKKDICPVAYQNLELKAKQYASLSGNRLFLPVNFMNRNNNIPRKIKQRKNDMVIKSSFIDSDTITYTIPVGYKVEFKPDDLEYKQIFGTYKTQISINANIVTYIRSYSLNKGHYATNEYNNFVEFKRNIAGADNVKMVLVKQ